MRNGIEKLKRQLTKIHRIGFDSMIFIYHFEGHPQLKQLTLPIFRKLDQENTQGITSILTVAEILSKKSVIENPFLTETYERIFRYWKNLKLIIPDYSLCQRAALLRIKYHLKLPDAIQLATSIISECQVFITNDELFSRCRKEIPILLLKKFI